MFASIFNAYQSAPMLCCTTTDLAIFSRPTVLGIFGVAFVIVSLDVCVVVFWTCQ